MYRIRNKWVVSTIILSLGIKIILTMKSLSLPQIGMVLLKPGWEADYYGRPDIASMGCAGRIKKFERLPDGKFNLILEGLSRFRILDEWDDKLYRLAKVNFLESTHDHPLNADYAEAVRQLISRYEEIIEIFLKKKEMGPRPQFQDCKTVGQAVDQIAHSLDWSPQRKQAFLEEVNVQDRLALVREEVDLKNRILRLSTVHKQNNTDIRWN